MLSLSFNTALISTLGLFSVASALPSSTRTAELETRDCPVNTWYSKCGDIAGCFNYDPCVNVNAKRTTPELQARDCPVNTWYSKCGDISGCFNYDPCNKPTCTPGTEGNSTGLSMYVVAPGDADLATPPFPYFQVQSGQADIDAVGIFTGIPADATSCTVYWRQGVERVFSVKGSGYVSVEQLEGLNAAQPVSWTAVEQATNVGRVGGAAMGNWDAPSYGAVEHEVGEAMGCAEQLTMLFSVDKAAAGANATDNTYLELDANNGWFIRYTC
jgi:hypothetical protein